MFSLNMLDSSLLSLLPPSCLKVGDGVGWVAYEIFETAQSLSLFYLTLGLDLGLRLGLVNWRKFPTLSGSGSDTPDTRHNEWTCIQQLFEQKTKLLDLVKFKPKIPLGSS